MVARGVGKLRHRVHIEEVTETRDDSGGVVPGWKHVGTCWANITPIRGREFWAAQQSQSDVTHRVTLRDNIRVNPRMRFVTLRRDRVLNIVSVLHRETEDIFLEVMCKETEAPDDARLMRG